MNASDSDPVEKMLHEQFDGPISDGGFSGRLTQRLPRRRRRVVWPLWVGIFAGAATCWVAQGISPLLQTGWHDVARGAWSAPAIVLMLAMAGMTLLALIWGVAEGNEH